MKLSLDIQIVPYDEKLGQKTLDEQNWSNKITDGIGEPIGEQVKEEE